MSKSSRVLITEPVWQNFSSMYREAKTAGEVITGMEASHHLTATLYFAVSALEAFLNQRMRLHRTDEKEADIFEILRKTALEDKIKKWPREILGKQVDLRPETIPRLVYYNRIRGALTHPKYRDHRDYEPLAELDPMEVVDAVAEYFSQFLLAAGEPFRYWLWGWNYLNPGRGGHEISLLFESQVVHSMRSLGFPSTPGSPLFSSAFESWQESNMRGYSGYARVAAFLDRLDTCEPKHPRFPHQPKLCKRWWDPEHHRTCGFVTPEAVTVAISYDDEVWTRSLGRNFGRKNRLQRIWVLLKFFFSGR
jgi:hypothetical protein